MTRSPRGDQSGKRAADASSGRSLLPSEAATNRPSWPGFGKTRPNTMSSGDAGGAASATSAAIPIEHLRMGGFYRWWQELQQGGGGWFHAQGAPGPQGSTGGGFRVSPTARLDEARDNA